MTRSVLQVEGFVEAAEDGALVGWAWHPGVPEQSVGLVARGPAGQVTLEATEPAEGVTVLPPLARPRRFRLDPAARRRLGDPVDILDRDGRHLWGSPVHPFVAQGPIAGPPRPDLTPRPVDVVVPVFGGGAETLACLRAVRASLPADSVLHVVDDGSPNPAFAATLARAAAAGQFRLHRHAANRGFPAAANTGLRAAAGHDVVLLNSDALVPPGWLERLRAAAYRDPAIGTATPLTGDGSIVSVRGDGDLDAAAQAANAGEIVDLPVGVGFCLFLRRDCLDQVGPLREDLFAQGYGEETEFCLRAAQCGWRHVAALDVFVRHRGAGTFGRAGAALLRRNGRMLHRLYPRFAAEVAAFERADPLHPARRRMAAIRWAEGRRDGAVIFVSHGEGGGTAELVAGRAGGVEASGQRAVVLLPAPGGCRIEGWDDLRFAIPAELPALVALLAPDRPARLELHHLAGHQPALLELADALGIPFETWVHDASGFCPRVALLGPARRYCGEPDVDTCERCVLEAGSNLPEPIGPRALRTRTAAILARSDRVVIATDDWARRMRRHFPAVRPTVEPPECDAALPPPAPQPRAPVARICVVGAIGPEKGFDVLLGCAADARARALPLEFVVVGVTEDDERLMAAGPVFVTGRYGPAEAVSLIRAQRAQLGFIPSIWPETWCFALSRAWQAGLAVAAFDLGAQAERIRATGRGHVLPLGLPPPRVNDALARLASATVRLQPSREMHPTSMFDPHV